MVKIRYAGLLLNNQNVSLPDMHMHDLKTVACCCRICYLLRYCTPPT